MSDIQKCQYCGHVYDANEEVHPACNKPQDERIKELEAKCPPRVWIHTLDRRSVVPVHALVHFEAEHEHHEYLSTEEHTAIVKGLEAKLTEARAEIERLRGALRTIFDKLPDHFALEYEDWKRIKAALAEGRVEENQCAHGIKSLTNCPWCNKPTLGVVV